MATAHRVVGSLAILRTKAGPDRYLYQGATLGDGFTDESIQHAISVGLVEEIEVPDEEPEATGAAAEEKPSKAWNHAQFDAWAAKQDPPIEFVNADPSKELTKEQKLEQIDAALNARK